MKHEKYSNDDLGPSCRCHGIRAMKNTKNSSVSR
jgi:hypothetical protein